jgi:hypothetical protein
MWFFTVFFCSFFFYFILFFSVLFHLTLFFANHSDLFCFLLYFYREPKMGNKDLTVSSFRQMCGRAGMLRLTHLITAECFSIRTVLFSSIAIISYFSILMTILSSFHCGLLLLPSLVFYIFILLIFLYVST